MDSALAPAAPSGAVRNTAVALITLARFTGTATRYALGPLQELARADLGLSDHQIALLQCLPGLAPSAAEVAPALLGRYRIDDLDADARLALDDDEFVLRIASAFGAYRLLLTPWSADLFGWQHTGALAGLGGTLVLVRDGARVTGLGLNTLRTRQLLARRLDG